MALALTYIPGYSNHLENVTDLGPAEERQSGGPSGQETTGGGGCDEETLLMSVSCLPPARAHCYRPALLTPDFLFGAFTLIPPMPL